MHGWRLWPWKYWGRMEMTAWSISQNYEDGFSVILNHHFWYTSRHNR